MSDPQTVSPTPDTAPAATPAMPEPATQAPATGTAETAGSEAPQVAGQAAPAEETFFSGDPNSLPPEIRKQYDNMLKDYKKKTSDVAEVRRRAEIYDAISKDQQFVDFWNKRLNGEQQAEKQIEQAKEQLEVSDEEFEQALSSKDEFLKMMAKVSRQSTSDLAKQLEETRSKLVTKEAAESLDEFAENGHQDIYDLENFGFISYQFKVNPQMKLDDAYKNAKQVYDEIYQKGFESAKKQSQDAMQKKVAASTERPTASPAGSYSGPPPKDLTTAEAMAWARKRVVVPQS